MLFFLLRGAPSNYDAQATLLGAFAAAYNSKVLDSGYQSIDMHCIVLPVKFDGELSISVLRNKQLFKKKGGQKVHPVSRSPSCLARKKYV
jgi:hypothetical protein